VHGTKQQTFRLHDIVYFVLRNDVSSNLSSVYYFPDNFVKHLSEVGKQGQLVVDLDNDGEIRGMCSWVYLDDERVKDINKLRWQYSDSISEGDIFYVTLCVLKQGSSIFKLREKIKQLVVGKNLTRASWTNLSKKKAFKRRIRK
jgi:hypothetical protein